MLHAVFVLQKKSLWVAHQMLLFMLICSNIVVCGQLVNMVDAACIFSGRATQQYHYVPSGEEPSVNLQGFTLPQPNEGVVVVVVG